ncbi:hypothetical protein FALBO_14091 [Fusarium albosuccineum]|uniref:Uncharacterized protein n=1 Tax=Fusarium albosuccineum TaxID=1237068 RepID=A0A8H4KYP6_9HYPO|nr:hypothetical protein FALBO_14091 [Fusarium albosuccineum]
MSDEIAPVNLQAYAINGHQAPDRCEMCDAPVPDGESRRKHMKETRHRNCPLCDNYVPVGGFYVHCDKAHANERWNDHQVAYTDRRDKEEALPWARGEEEKL